MAQTVKRNEKIIIIRIIIRGPIEIPKSANN